MSKYTILFVFEIILVLIVLLFSRRQLRFKPILLTLVCLTIITCIFDSWLTAWPIVQYNSVAISGIRLGTIPFEDFGYTILAGILIPIVFEIIHGHQKNHPSNSRNNPDQPSG